MGGCDDSSCCRGKDGGTTTSRVELLALMTGTFQKRRTGDGKIVMVVRDRKDSIQAMLRQGQDEVHQLRKKMRLEKGVERIGVGRHHARKGQVRQAALGEGEGHEECSL